MKAESFREEITFMLIKAISIKTHIQNLETDVNNSGLPGWLFLYNQMLTSRGYLILKIFYVIFSFQYIF